MTVKYKTVITKAGAIKLAAATTPNGKKVNFTAMAIGDGGGTLPVPDDSQTKLVNEVWRHALNKISQDNKNKNYVIAELVIPPEIGGFWMRETGLYDDTGTLIAVGNMAESYKPKLEEGSGRAQTVRMVIMVSDIESVELTIDTSTVMATQDYVDDKIAEHEQSRRHPDATLTAKGFTQLSSATDSTSEMLAATPKAVKVVYDLAKAKYTAQDATTAQKGIVQLSSATDSVSESVAATPKAVKAAYDLAKGKYTAQDATTVQKGIVQLSSATDSSSEVLAATPKAVKSVNDSLTELKKILGTAAVKDAQTSKDDVTAGRLLVNGGAIALRTVAAKADATGSNVTDANKLPANSVSFLYPTADNSAKINGSLIDFSGLGGGYNIQITGQYSGGGKSIKFRTRDGDQQIWNPWYDIYHSGNKPTAADVNALPLSGGEMTGQISLSNTGKGMWSQQNNIGAPLYQLINTPATSEYWPVFKQKYSQGNSTWSGGMLINGDTFHIHYINGSGVTATFAFNKNGQFLPQSYDNFDGRYYTKAQSDAGYMPKTGAYTKAESDARYQPKGSYASPNTMGNTAGIIWWRCGSTGNMRISGVVSSVANGGRVTFPTAFPNNCTAVIPTRNEEPGNSAAMQPFNVDRTGFNLRIAGGGTVRLMFVAEGN
ncbi:phage tail protein [Enterobacter sichuanensis]|uniref:phage tail-collar fiber domain-containing protein n=1 Tax=Enterobacter sichuanensis TaxID=2071710 RepID=UPI002B1FFEB0|nr:phage tail protein [Enterobacter sichuanensis]MEA5170603.1 phage tail protein [Enterobacter sichuanensis]